jgi:hypothetical protein
MGHGAFAILQLRSSDHQATPRHDQVDDPPQDPATLAVVIPAEQANCVELSQEPFTGHEAFALLQVRSLVPPLIPRHDQVADHPHNPGRLFDVIPRVQAKFVALSHAPFTIQSGFNLVQLRSSVPP